MTLGFEFYIIKKLICRRDGIGRRAGLKIQSWQQGAGSTPAAGTKGCLIDSPFNFAIFANNYKGDIMCTAATYKTKDFYFGRTLDYEFSYGDQITITPRNYKFDFRFMGEVKNHFAIIGMAHIANDYPLYYDAMNEKGVCIAGLNFVGNAVYNNPIEKKENIAQFELIPWILCQCENMNDVRNSLEKINITNTPFSDKLPTAQLHYIIADKNDCITLECTKDGMNIYDNNVGVLTNNPPFNIQMFMLNNYMSLSPKQPNNNFDESINLKQYSRGMGALGLPGDLSSASRFARVAFTKLNSKSSDNEKDSVSQFFHILGSVDQQRGCCEVSEGKYEITIYTSCCNADKGIYYYTTYNCHRINAVDMHKVNLDDSKLFAYDLIEDEQIFFQN